MILELLIGFFILVCLMVTETLLSAKMENPLWGAIIPLLVMAVSIAVFATGMLPLEIHYGFPFIMVNVIFLGNWTTVRDQRKKILRARRQQQEEQARQEEENRRQTP